MFTNCIVSLADPNHPGQVQVCNYAPHLERRRRSVEFEHTQHNVDCQLIVTLLRRSCVPTKDECVGISDLMVAQCQICQSEPSHQGNSITLALVTPRLWFCGSFSTCRDWHGIDVQPLTADSHYSGRLCASHFTKQTTRWGREIQLIKSVTGAYY